MKEMPGSPNRSAIAQIEQFSRNFERVVQQLRHGSRLSRSVIGISDMLTVLGSRSVALNAALAKNRVLIQGVAEARRSLVALDAALAKNRMFSSLNHEFSVPPFIQLEECKSISPHTLHQYRPSNQFGTKPYGTDLIEDEVVVIELLKYSEFELALYHFLESVGTFRSGYYAASNSQVRTFLEAFLTGLCSRMTNKEATNAHSAIDQLKAKGFLAKDEYTNLKSLWSMSNTNGSHPGSASQQDTLGRILIATDIVKRLIAKLKLI